MDGGSEQLVGGGSSEVKGGCVGLSQDLLPVFGGSSLRFL